MQNQPVFKVYSEHLQNYKHPLTSYFETLRSDMVKQHHWKALFDKLKPKDIRMDNYQMNLCLFHMWDADMLRTENDKAFNDIMTRARGEAILEKTVRNISETWEEKEF
jgi:hypothetical protein